MLTKLTTAELEFLGTRNQDRRLDLLVRPSRDATTGVALASFESIEACQAEDRYWAAALSEFDCSALPSVPECEAGELAALLDSIADPNRTTPTQSCLASSLYLRDRRIGILGATLDLVHAHPELDCAWVSAHHPCLCFDQHENWSGVIGEARTRLHRQLEVSGATTAPGFLIGFLNGNFDPRTEKFRLEYRGIAAGDKLKSLRQPQPVVPNRRPLRGMRIDVHEITDLPMQISRMLPHSARERVPSVIDGGVPAKRMRQPYHTIYLIWLAGYRLADLTVIDGAFYWNGGLRMRECYEEAAFQPPHAAVPTLFAPVPKAQRVPRSSSARVKPAREGRSKPRDVYRNQSNRKRQRRVAAIFRNANQSLNERDRLLPGIINAATPEECLKGALWFGVSSGPK